jgi:Na+/citrate or Na+/malate symporter
MHPLFQASLLKSYLLQCRHRSDGLPAVVVGDTAESAGEVKTALETSILTLLSLGGNCPTKVEETAARCDEVAKMVRLFTLLSCSLMLPFIFVVHVCSLIWYLVVLLFVISRSSTGSLTKRKLEYYRIPSATTPLVPFM